MFQGTTINLNSYQHLETNGALKICMKYLAGDLPISEWRLAHHILNPLHQGRISSKIRRVYRSLEINSYR